ncbi:MAG: hypothetical protein M1434_13815 [Chloroflexi bacterium]|nr:hypothetical protein [Chloroflexota bacterium]MCL5275799.1 hypothetical protein [Chloroflexota bacterium]
MLRIDEMTGVGFGDEQLKRFKVIQKLAVQRADMPLTGVLCVVHHHNVVGK